MSKWLAASVVLVAMVGCKKEEPAKPTAPPPTTPKTTPQAAMNSMATTVRATTMPSR